KFTREDLDLTQKEISEILGIKRGIYTAMENGIVSFPLPIIEKLSDYYNLSIDYLTGITNNKRYMINPLSANFDDLGKQIRKIRRYNRLSQENLAEDLKIKQSSYAAYENGKTQIKLDKLYILAVKYNFSIDGVLGKFDYTYNK
ncbi:MAG: helix-turn-helix transcriptional regulator, partial [Bacilli bacterium]|nr:helix-turn-helix transcriptional regulator [Bacilli bacterium]